MGKVRVNWGDGVISDTTVADPPAPWAISPNHTYALPGNYTITITGATSAVIETLEVTVPSGDAVGYGVGDYGTGPYGE